MTPFNNAQYEKPIHIIKDALSMAKKWNPVWKWLMRTAVILKNPVFFF